MDRLLATDLNLLVTLHALLETQSTKAAAERLGRTQPAVSHALGRLRLIFEDPLFVRVGWRLEPTPRAEGLRAPLARLLGEMDALMAEPDGFAAARSDRAFRIACPDYCVAMLASIASRVRLAAPGVSLRFVDAAPDSVDQLDRGGLDAVIAPARPPYPDAVDARPFAALDWRVFVRAEHPLDDPPAIEDWAAFPHVEVAGAAARPSPVEDAVRAVGVSRHVAASAPNYLAAASLLDLGDYVLTAPETALDRVGAALNLRRLRPPIEPPRIELVFSVSRRRAKDPAILWLRGRFEDERRDAAYAASARSLVDERAEFEEDPDG